MKFYNFYHISLTRNDLIFDEKCYLQITGTAMGKPFSLAYANIYMADWEETAFPKCQKKPDHYFRYLGDIWGVWTHSKEEFEIFVNILNNHHTLIKVEPTTHPTKVDFLDTEVYKGPAFIV